MTTSANPYGPERSGWQRSEELRWRLLEAHASEHEDLAMESRYAGS